jgi:type 1 glutamine amidotransferase
MSALTRNSGSRIEMPYSRVAFVLVCLVLSLVGTLGHADDVKAKRVLLLGQSPDDHPPGTHEYLPGMRILAKCLQDVPGLEVEVIRADGAWEDGPDLIRKADCVVLFLAEGAKWMHEDPRRLEAFAQLAAREGGLVALHWGMGTRESEYIDGFLRLFGGCHGGPDRKYKVVETQVRVADSDHDIVRGVAPLMLREEFYYQLKLIDAKRVRPILQTTIDGKNETVAWAWQRADGGRSFGFSGGHFHHHWSRIEYRRLMSQAVLWTLKLPVPKDGLPVKVSKEDLALPATP